MTNKDKWTIVPKVATEDISNAIEYDAVYGGKFGAISNPVDIYQAALKAAPPHNFVIEQDWLPIEQHDKDNKDNVLLWDGNYFNIGNYDSDYEEYTDDFGNTITPTHFKPLNPPKERK